MRVIKPDQGCILTINGGSSSIKFALYQTGKPLKRSLWGRLTASACPIRIWLSPTRPGIGRTAAASPPRSVDWTRSSSQGGIGENAPAVRARICEGLGFLGIELNESRNATHANVISSDAGRVSVRVIGTDEELMIARSVCRILGPSAVNRKD